MSDEFDTILDACLTEVVGRKAPPDLSARILRRWEQSAQSAADELLPPACESQLAHQAVSPVVERPSAIPAGSRRGRKRQDRSVIAIAAAAAALGLCVLLATVNTLWNRDQEREQWAQQPTSESPSVSEISPTGSIPREANREQGSGPNLAGTAAPAPRDPATSVVTAPPTPAVPSPSSVASPSSPGLPPPATPATPGPSPTEVIAAAPLPTPLPTDQVLAQLNDSVRAEWQRVGATAPERISAEAWRERAFSVLVGRVPTAAECERFPAATPAACAELIRELTRGETYAEEFARRWSALLASVYLPRELTSAGNSFDREGMLQYFRRALLEGRPWDRVVSELLTATGSGRPGTPDYNGASNFLLARTGGKLELATADTARLFLGRDIACIACHDNLSGGGGEQREFWELNSFFRQLALERDPQTQLDRLKDVDFLGEDRRDGANAVVFFETPGGLLKSAYPTWPGVGEFPKGGVVSEVNRREWLARCVTSSAEFRWVTANQFWELVYGVELVPSTGLASAPEPTRRLLTTVGDQWASQAFDPRTLIGWFVANDAFAVPPVDAAGTALVASSTLRFRGYAAPAPVDFRRAWLAVTQSPPEAPGPLNARVINGPVPPPSGVSPDVSPDATLLHGGAAAKMDATTRRVLASSKLSARQKTEHLFWSMLGRAPRRAEWELVEPLVAKADPASEKSWEQVWAALGAAAEPSPSK